MKRIGVLWLAVTLASCGAWAQTRGQPTGSQAGNPANDISLEIKLESSRAQPGVGSGLGITAEFKNKSSKAVLYLTEATTTLTLPPELEGPLSPLLRRTAFFPTEGAAEAGHSPMIAIQPGYSYRAGWVQNSSEDKRDKTLGDEMFLWVEAWRQIKSEIRYVFFTPGEYKVFVETKAGVDKPPTEPGYYTFSETAVVKGVAPQSVILLGAMLGGLISWFLFPQGREKTLPLDKSLKGAWLTTRHVFWYVYSIAGACLLSAIVTILLARLSETQFLIKISVSDFWGAIAVGFIAQYAGKSLLDKIIPGRYRGQSGSPDRKGKAGAAKDGHASPATPTAA